MSADLIAEIVASLNHIDPQVRDWDATDHRKWPSSTFEMGNAFRNLLVGLRRNVPKLLDALTAAQARVEESEQIERNRDMWRGQCERQAEALTELRAERDQARSIVRDIHWMARRYADGRSTYAPGMFNDAIEKARGWLEDITSARDGASPEYRSLEARATAAEAEIAGLRGVLGFDGDRANDASLNLQGVEDDLKGQFPPGDGGVCASTVGRVTGQLEAARALLGE